MTLIELVVAMAVFALVAVMGLQSLSGMIRQRERAADFSSENAELGYGIAMLRNDLASVVPMLFFPPGGGTQSAVLMPPGGGGLAMSVAPVHDYAPLGPVGLVQRVEYRLDPVEGTLLRRVWATAWPVSDQALSRETRVMSDVTSLRLRSYWHGYGWVEGLRIAQLSNAPRAPEEADGQDGSTAAPEVYSDLLPLAIEVTLRSAKWGEITLIEAL